ncbi:hypothetical protein HA402_007076 [Bradysia odoriphaga]|nr:hypothetical protein HA402_007076 [Bradysia odoriphaga]
MTDDKNLYGPQLVHVWRTCNKIRSAVFKTKLNLWDCFKCSDPSKNTLISESKFITILTTNLKDSVGLTDQEINELTDYFKVQNGQIAYAQFCSVIHDNEPHPSYNLDFVTGLEWEDHLATNRLSSSENRRIRVLLTKIASTVRLRDVVFRPYFQDYELVAKNCGTVTLAHFARVLHFLKINVSADEFQLLLKRFIKDSYTVNYVAFVEEIENIVRDLDSKRLIDFSEDFVENFPGKVITANLPKLPRPEIDNVCISDVFGNAPSSHPVFTKTRDNMIFDELIQRVKRHVLENSLRVKDFFEDNDPLRCGYITKSQFIRGLDILGVSKVGRLYLSPREIEILCSNYVDEMDSGRVNWKMFETDIEEVVLIRNLDKRPYTIVELPEQEILELPKQGVECWNDQDPDTRDFCEETIFRIKSRIVKRQLYLEPYFKDLDKLNIGHVTSTQMRRVLTQYGILVSDEEFNVLVKRYADDMGFNYVWFLKEVDPEEYLIYASRFEENRRPPAPENRLPNEKCEQKTNQLNIIHVFAKIKGIAARNRVRIMDFLKNFDKHNELCIVETDFRRGLNLAGIHLEHMELNLICEVFRSPLRKNYVDYKRFCDSVEEVFCQANLERAPLIVPLQHVPSDDNSHNFLNFDERQLVSTALTKLAKYPDHVANLDSLFQDFDRRNFGTVTQNQFLRVLTARSMHDLISPREFNVVCKCFGVQKGLRTEFSYRSFLKNLHILFCNSRQHPF